MNTTEPRCLNCDHPMVSHSTYNNMSKERRSFLRRHHGRGLCSKCHKRAARAKNQPPQRPRKTTIRHAVLFSLMSTVGLPLFAFDETLPCRDESVDPEWWFSYDDDDTGLAKQICSTCPVQRRCLEGAQERREEWGVWGGEVIRQGELVPSQRENQTKEEVA